MKITAIRTKIFQEGENLIDFILEHIPNIPENSTLVVTSKIVALAESRTATIKNEIEKEGLIKAESSWAFRTKYVWLTIKDGMVMPSAGIDESNANGKIILLPKDSYASAEYIRKLLMKKFRLTNLGVLITDSRTLPLRAGIIGVNLGYAGFSGVHDYREEPDIFGRKFKFSRVDVADSLAAAAVLTMGEGSEQKPLALIEKASIKFIDKIDRTEHDIDIEDDMYGPLFSHIDLL